MRVIITDESKLDTGKLLKEFERKSLVGEKKVFDRIYTVCRLWVPSTRNITTAPRRSMWVNALTVQVDWDSARSQQRRKIKLNQKIYVVYNTQLCDFFLRPLSVGLYRWKKEQVWQLPQCTTTHTRIRKPQGAVDSDSFWDARSSTGIFILDSSRRHSASVVPGEEERRKGRRVFSEPKIIRVCALVACATKFLSSKNQKLKV